MNYEKRPAWFDEAADLIYERGASFRRVGKRLGIPSSTIHSVMKRAGMTEAKPNGNGFPRFLAIYSDRQFRLQAIVAAKSGGSKTWTDLGKPYGLTGRQIQDAMRRHCRRNRIDWPL